MDKIKIVILGSTKTGKTTILTQYIQNIFLLDNQMTISIDKNIKKIKLKNKLLILEIWDTPGNQKLYPLNEICIKNSKIIILVYDITNKNTFNDLNDLIKSVNEINKEEPIFCIIGNKKDLKEKREVNEEEGEIFAEKYNFLFFEISAKDYNKIENIFFKLSEIYLNIKQKEIDEEEQAKKEGKQIIKYDNKDKYIGFIIKNKREGKGIMKYNNGDIYEGNWKNNLKDGKGIMKYNNGDIYDGNWKNDLKEGYGILIDKNMNKFRVNWKNNLKEGKGKLIKNNGDEYNLNWIKDIAYYGIINYKDGDIYEGQLKNYKLEGKGKMKYKKGDIYEGNWENDLKEGKGKYIFKEGYYEGEWINNELNGKGKIYYNNSKIFDGYFINGKREGKGKITNKNNDDILELNFKNDKIEGKGKLIYKNGNILRGYFDNNKYNPINGILEYLNGDTYEGNFDENGKREGEGIMKNKNGKIYYGGFYYKNEGLFCINKNDYYILKDKRINDINEIFNLNINNVFYKGEFNNNKKEGEGMLYEKNKFNYKMIYKGNFNEHLKDGFGIIYYETGSILESFWIKDEINDEKESTFYLTDLIKFTKTNLNKIEWINFIKMKIFNHFGNITLNNHKKDIIK